jgi:WD40 repeat protein
MPRLDRWLLVASLALFPGSQFVVAQSPDGNGRPVNQPAHADHQGSPLPTGAVARMPASQIHAGEWVLAATLSADGKTMVLAVGLEKIGVRVLEAGTGRLLRSFSVPLEYPPLRTLSPDGSCLALQSEDGQLHLWDVTTGKQLHRLAPAEGRISSVVFSADGKTVAGIVTKSELDPKIYIWDVATGQARGRFASLQNWRIGIALSADGKLLASWGQEVRRGERARNQERRRTLQLWGVASGKELRRILVRGAPVEAACFTSDSRTVATSDGNGEIQLWQVATGELIHSFTGAEDIGPVFRFAPDGKQLAAVAANGEIYCWSAATGKGLGRYRLPAGDVYSLVFLSTGTMRALGGEPWPARGLWLWDPPSDSGGGTVLTGGHQGPVLAAAFMASGNLATLGGDGKVCIWEKRTGKLLRQNPISQVSLHDAYAFSPDGRYLALADGRGRFCLFAAATGEKVREFTSRLLPHERLTFSADSSLLAVRDSNQVTIYEVETGTQRSRFPIPSDPVYSTPVAFSPEGNIFLCTGPDHNRLIRTHEVVSGLHFYEAKTGKELHALEVVTNMSSTYLAASPNGRPLALVSVLQGSFYDVTAWKRLRQFDAGHAGLCRPVFAPDGRTLAIASWQRERGEPSRQPKQGESKVRVLEVATGKPRHTLDIGPRGPEVYCLAFSADARWLATGLEDGSVLVWDLAGPPASGLQPSAAELDKLWADLAVEDPGAGLRAIQRLRGAPADAVALLRRKLPPAVIPGGDAKEIARLLALLDDDDFHTREQASSDLRRLGEKARPALTRTLGGKPSAEVRRRLEQILENLGGPEPPGAMVRPLRALEVLEHLGTLEARRLIEELTGGSPDAQLTQEAKAVLGRLGRTTPRE